LSCGISFGPAVEILSASASQLSYYLPLVILYLTGYSGLKVFHPSPRWSSSYLLAQY